LVSGINILLSAYQYGFLKCRDTLHVPADVQVQVKEVFRSNSNCYSIFFDTMEAHPRVWRHCISQSEFGLRGILPKVIPDFLSNCELVIKFHDQFSSPHIIENGVPQESVLNVFLFLVAINNVVLSTRFLLTQRLLRAICTLRKLE